VGIYGNGSCTCGGEKCVTIVYTSKLALNRLDRFFFFSDFYPARNVHGYRSGCCI